MCFRIPQRRGRPSGAGRPNRRRRVQVPVVSSVDAVELTVLSHPQIMVPYHCQHCPIDSPYTPPQQPYSPCSIPFPCTGKQCWRESWTPQRPRCAPCYEARADDTACRGMSPCTREPPPGGSYVPVLAVGGTTGHGSEKIRVDLNDLFDRSRRCR